MISVKKRDWIEILIHIAFWVGVFYTLSSLTDSFVRVRVNGTGMVMQQDMKQTLLPYTFVTLGFLILLFYGNIFWVLKKTLRYKHIWSRVALGGGWFFVIFMANYYLGNIMQPAPANTDMLFRAIYLKKSDKGIPKGDHLLHTTVATMFSKGGFSHLQLTIVLIFLGVFGLSIAYFFLKEWAKSELMHNRLQAHQLNTEIKFLKSQINPHFLFNTLNNLFSMAQGKGNDELADGISKLSGMMRYMIYESNEESVPLKKEIEYLENCIVLNKLRYADEEVQVIFDRPEKTDGIFIAPMLFIPFVENAFKHGVSIGASSQIHISITLTPQQLIFSCENTSYSFIKKMVEEKSGIGLENVKRRLQLVYPGKHQLKIHDEDKKFSVKLEIDLK